MTMVGEEEGTGEKGRQSSATGDTVGSWPSQYKEPSPGLTMTLSSALLPGKFQLKCQA